MRAAFAQRKILGRNGASRIILEQMKLFREAGHEVHLYCARLKVEVPSGVHVHKYFSLSINKEKRREGYASGFEKFCRKNKIDIAVGNGDTLYQNILFMHNTLELENTIMGGDGSHKKSPIFQVHDRILSEKKFDALVCSSNLMKNYFMERYSIEPSKVFVAYPGYEPSTFNTGGRDAADRLIRQRHGIDRKYILGFISSGNLKKRGIDVLIRAVSGLNADISSDISLLLVGKDEKAELYKHDLEQNNKNLQVIVVGSVSDVENYYKACSILLHPAHIEEFGMTILEAMGCGTPVLTSAMPGASEVFPDCMKDFVTPEPDPVKLAEYVESLLKNEDMRGRLGNECAKEAVKHSWDNYFKSLTSVYRACGTSGM